MTDNDKPQADKFKDAAHEHGCDVVQLNTPALAAETDFGLPVVAAPVHTAGPLPIEAGGNRSDDLSVRKD